ncbi:MAG: aminotransferase class I/II-fold pyridoxal phosphate-dependent enzyme [Propionibacteriaceae bacterium]|jgi:cystathionine beta-lyase|nr:aminotransferase class I/II-fold pyridoxal phosphate-dependent enzyme [Propionibacteriaceae bacterium]
MSVEETIARLRANDSMKWVNYPGEIGAWVAEMDFGVAPKIRQGLLDAVDKGLFGYISAQMDENLRSTTAKWLGHRFGWEVASTDVMRISDVLHGLTIMMDRFVEPGPVIVPTPAYMPFMWMPQKWHREAIHVPMQFSDGWHFDLDGIDAAFARGAKILVLCNPYNPLGAVFSAEELAAVGEVVERHGGQVFADEIHAPLTLFGNRHTPYASVNAVNAGHSLTAIAASKGWNIAGLRCAQLVLTNDRYRKLAEDWAFEVKDGASILGTIATIGAYQSEDWLDSVISKLEANVSILEDALANVLVKVRYHRPQATYLVWLDFRDYGVDDLVERIHAAGVAVTDGAACGRPGFVRLNLATEPDVLEEALRRIAGVVA